MITTPGSRARKTETSAVRKGMSQKGIPLFLSFGLLVFVAIVTSGVLFTWLSRWHDTKLYTRQSHKNVKFMVDSVRSRIAAPVVVEDYDQVDLIMRESFGTDMNVVGALVINNQGKVYYDLAGDREGRTFDESLMPQGEYVFDEPIELLGGMGFMVPDGSVVGRLIVEARVFDPITDKQLSSLMHYSRALISDLNAKLENNEVFGARSILANMMQNSDSVNYVQWIDQEGMIRAYMDKDNPEGGDTSVEGTRIADNDSIGTRAMSVTVRKPLLIQEVGTLKGAPLMDIAIPLVHKGEKVGVVRLGYSNREFADTRRQARNAMIVIICAFLVSGLLLGFAVAYPHGPAHPGPGLGRAQGRAR